MAENFTLDPNLFEKTYWMLCDCHDIWDQCEGEKELKMRKLIYQLASRIKSEFDVDGNRINLSAAEYQD